MDVLGMVQKSYDSPPAYEEAAPGVPQDHRSVQTVGDLLAINYKAVGVREQMRRNLLAAAGSDSERYPGIIGFDEDVLPSIDRAILAGHDILLVGQMGQAKTMLARGIAASLLSPMPVVRGGTTNDIPTDLPPGDLAALLRGEEIPDPLRFHVSPEAARAIMNDGLDTPVEWVDGTVRSRFVTATPDTTVKDPGGVRGRHQGGQARHRDVPHRVVLGRAPDAVQARHILHRRAARAGPAKAGCTALRIAGGLVHDGHLPCNIRAPAGALCHGPTPSTTPTPGAS